MPEGLNRALTLPTSKCTERAKDAEMTTGTRGGMRTAIAASSGETTTEKTSGARDVEGDSTELQAATLSKSATALSESVTTQWKRIEAE